MSLVYVFAASPMEGKPVRKLAGPPDPDSPGSCGPNQVLLVLSGMGPKNSGSKAEAVLDTFSAAAEGKPDAVLVVGLCGGLTESLSEGRIVVYSECGSTDPSAPRLVCSPAISEAIASHLESSSIGCERVPGITSRRIATTRVERTGLAKRGAAVVDMESYSILKVAAAAGIPAAVLRVVSDSVDRELPDFNRALNDAGGLDGRKAMGVALRAPLRTARLLAANRRALQRLEKALEVVLRAPCFGETQPRK
jgi:nucleoside phosphorylase